MKLKIYNETKIYILCPPFYATGGTELLHQLCDLLNELKHDAYIYYSPRKNNPTAERFKNYNIQIAKTIEDNYQNIFIASEIDNYPVYEFNKIQKVIWWLSVDNHFKNKFIRKSNLKIRIKDIVFNRRYFDFENKDAFDFIHFAQSHYAKTFLESKGAKDVYMLSDYINKEFFKEVPSFKNKENIVLYNPKKGLKMISKLIAFSQNIKWVPLENMTLKEIQKLLTKAKVYIDFGEHPGKDRFPREAAVSGCCVITNTKGSAKYFEDVSIQDEFKFDLDKIELSVVIGCIENCFENYEDEILKFANYRSKIFKEKEIFQLETKQIFSGN